MNHLQMIHQFIKEKRNLNEIPDTGLPFVTISRQAAAGGHLFSYVLLTDMLKENTELFRGWHVFDKQLCEVIAEDPELADSVQSLLLERYRSEFREFIDSLFAGRSKQFALYQKTFRVVRMLAALGKVIIVGRASRWVTRDLPRGAHVLLVAPEEQRVLWMMKKLKMGKDEARAAVIRQDAERAKLVKTFFSKDVDDAVEYDVAWNTAKAEMHDISSSIIRLLKTRAESPA